jgi:hypothetical protein
MSSTISTSQKPKAVFECKLWSDKYRSTDYTTRIRQIGRYVQFSVLRQRFPHDGEAGSVSKSATDKAFTVDNRKRATLTRRVYRVGADHPGAFVLCDQQKPPRPARAGQRSRCVPLSSDTSTSRKPTSVGAGSSKRTNPRRKLDCRTLCEACGKPREEAIDARFGQEGSKCDAIPKPEGDPSGRLAVAIGQHAQQGPVAEAML